MSCLPSYMPLEKPETQTFIILKVRILSKYSFVIGNGMPLLKILTRETLLLDFINKWCDIFICGNIIYVGLSNPPTLQRLNYELFLNGKIQNGIVQYPEFELKISSLFYFPIDVPIDIGLYRWRLFNNTTLSLKKNILVW